MSQFIYQSENRARLVSRGILTIAAFAIFALAVLILMPTYTARAQSNAHVTACDPASGKVNDSVTVTGDGLAKGGVTAIYLSDDKDDFKATLVSQEATKIVFKVPQVKAGNYNISIQVGTSLLIQPVHFAVEQ